MKANGNGKAGRPVRGRPAAGGRLEEIRRLLRKALPDIRRRYGVNYLGVFGSYIHGRQKKGSDLDVLVEFSRTLTLIEFIHLENELSDMLNVNVDLVDRSVLKPALGKGILEEVVAV
jgi:predicted nucleotidyltransferase